MVASSYVLAATVVSALVFFVGMPLGRRGCILVGDGLVVVGSAIQATAFSMPHIIVGRVICVRCHNITQLFALFANSFRVSESA